MAESQLESIAVKHDEFIDRVEHLPKSAAEVLVAERVPWYPAK
jgi:hypothetical protein